MFEETSIPLNPSHKYAVDLHWSDIYLTPQSTHGDITADYTKIYTLPEKSSLPHLYYILFESSLRTAVEIYLRNLNLVSIYIAVLCSPLLNKLYWLTVRGLPVYSSCSLLTGTPAGSRRCQSGHLAVCTAKPYMFSYQEISSVMSFGTTPVQLIVFLTHCLCSGTKQSGNLGDISF